MRVKSCHRPATSAPLLTLLPSLDIQVQALLKQADSNGDGKISYDEWVEVRSRDPSLRSAP